MLLVVYYYGFAAASIMVLNQHALVLILMLFNFRHSPDMIEKLETAGLGFYVRATETQQKLGMYMQSHNM